MTTHDLLSHFNLTQLPFSKEIAPEHLLGLPSLERALRSTSSVSRWWVCLVESLTCTKRKME